MLATGFAVYVAIACLGTSAQATQQQSDQALRAVQQVILANIKAGDYDAAIRAAELFEPQHPNHASRVAFVRGMVAKAKGENRKAAKEFRTVLADQPNLTPAREQLAHALFLVGDYDAASHHFDILESTTSNPRLRDLYSSYKSSIAQRRPYSLSAYVTLAPSTNINRGTAHDSVELFGISGAINEEAKQKSGFGLAAGGYGSYDWQLGEGFGLRLAGSTDGRLYSDDINDVLRFTASLKPSYETEDRKLRLSVGPYAETVLNDYDVSVWRYGPSADMAWLLGNGFIFSGTAAALVQDNTGDERYDGMRYSFETQLMKNVSPSMSIGLNSGLLIENIESKNLDHLDWQVGASVSNEWSGGWITRLAPSVGHHSYEGQLVLLPEAREDWHYGVAIQLSNRNFSAYGFMPVLNYGYTKQNSNDVFSDYESHDLSISLTRGF